MIMVHLAMSFSLMKSAGTMSVKNNQNQMELWPPVNLFDCLSNLYNFHISYNYLFISLSLAFTDVDIIAHN